jgi:hypothetical protein
MNSNMTALANAHLAGGAPHHEAAALAADDIHPSHAPLQHGRIVLANESRFTESYFSRPLTTYAVGYRDPAALEEELEFFAPRVPVTRRFEYAEFSNAEEWFSETTDDLRTFHADFKRVEYTSKKVNAKTENRGLTMRVDLDEVSETSGWEERSVSKLLRRLRRNSLRRAFALLSAAATNTAKTWDTTAGKDPDQDVVLDLVTAADSSGVRPTRIGYGETAWSKRILAHRAQNSAGGFASAGLGEGALAQFLGVDQVRVSKARYQSAAAAKTQVVGNLVLMFNAMSGQDSEDASNIKRFVSPTISGGDVRVYTQQVGAKLYDITVEHYEALKITSTLGIRKFTVS